MEREAAAQRRSQKPRAGRRPDERELRHVQPHAARVGPLVYHYVDSEILHRPVQELLHGAGYAVDFVDEQYVALLQVGKQAREVGRLFDYGAGSHADLRAHLVCENKRERRLAEPGRAVEEYVAERVPPAAGSAHHDFQALDRLGLPRERVEPRRAQRRVNVVLPAFESLANVVGALFHVSIFFTNYPLNRTLHRIGIL